MDDIDRISNLPDEILVEILSRLSLREAARTTVLARRWAHLSARVTRRLDFDASEVMDDLRWLRKDRRVESELYAGWVSRLLLRHAAPNLDELRIRFDLDSRFSGDIDAWIAFAAAKRAKKLLLEFPARWGAIAADPYRFPIAATLSSLRPVGFRSLTDLTLGFVAFSGDDETVQFLVDNCPALEHLCVRRSRGFRSLRAVGPALRLRSLRILACPEINSVRIAAQSLETFEYDGPLIDVPFEGVPRLSEALLGGEGAMSLLSHTHVLFAHFAQLRTLKLDISLTVYGAMARSFPAQVPELSSLEQLELRADAVDTHSIMWTCLLVKAAPLLQRFSMKINTEVHGHFIAEPVDKDRLKELKNASVFLHHRLKVLELIGYANSMSEKELCLRLVWNAVVLEKLIIDVDNPFLKERPWLLLDLEKLDTVRKECKLLGSVIPPGVDLVIV